MSSCDKIVSIVSITNSSPAIQIEQMVRHIKKTQPYAQCNATISAGYLCFKRAFLFRASQIKNSDLIDTDTVEHVLGDGYTLRLIGNNVILFYQIPKLLTLEDGI